MEKMKKTMMSRLTLTFAILLLPVSQALAAETDLNLRDRALLRGIERMETSTDYGMRTNLIRLGNNVRTRRMSPRRILSSNEGMVLQVIDGSVLQVQLSDGTIETVRTLGAEAPLLTTGSDSEQCFALDARTKLRMLLDGKTVQLERDRYYQRDTFGRLLRYVRLNAMDVNAWMIENGYAFADNRNSHRRQNDYLARQAEARKYKRGLWGNFCEYNPDLETIEVIE